MINHNFLLSHPGAALRVVEPDVDGDASAYVQLDGALSVEFRAKPEGSGQSLEIAIHSAPVPGVRGGEPKRPASKLWLRVPERDITGYAATDLITTLAREVAIKVRDAGETFDKAVSYACDELQKLPQVSRNLRDSA